MFVKPGAGYIHKQSIFDPREAAGRECSAVFSAPLPPHPPQLPHLAHVCASVTLSGRLRPVGRPDFARQGPLATADTGGPTFREAIAGGMTPRPANTRRRWLPSDVIRLPGFATSWLLFAARKWFSAVPATLRP